MTLATLVDQSVALAAGGTKTFTVSVNRPAGLVADTYQIVANIVPVQGAGGVKHVDNLVTSPTKTVTSAPAFMNLAGTLSVAVVERPAVLSNRRPAAGRQHLGRRKKLRQRGAGPPASR